MDRFDQAALTAAEFRATQREQAARRAAARGAPQTAARLRRAADYDRRIVEDLRRWDDWTAQRMDESLP